MREIWFKGKRKDSDEWVEGYYIVHSNSVTHPYSHTDGKHCINTIPHGFSFEVDPETICQYTGLIDRLSIMKRMLLFAGFTMEKEDCSIFSSTKLLQISAR